MKYTKSKSELLEWLNSITKSQYKTLQDCADGVGYLQVLDAIHSEIPIRRLNLHSKIPEDNLRNLKLLEEALRKLKVAQKFSYDKMAERKTSQNLYFLQWLYVYASAYSQQDLLQYDGIQKRLMVLQKQGKSLKDMSPHLRSFKNQYQYYNHTQNEEDDQQYIQDIDQQPYQQPADDFTRQLQTDIKSRMQINWKLMNNIEKVIDQRNNLNIVLNKIYENVHKMKPSKLKQQLETILTETPDDFKCNN